MNPSQGFDVSQIVAAIYRRKDMVIALFIVVVILAVFLAMNLPDIYRSSTLILVTPQKLPANYVAATVTSTIEQRMEGIKQQILGRTMLGKVIREFDLLPGHNSLDNQNIDVLVAMLRKKITLEINRTGDIFTISFDDKTPEIARRVTARLASLFIEENVKAREQQAAGTTSFINVEAERLRKELEEQEAKVNQFRAKYWYELPENRDTNSKVLDQLQRELENGISRLVLLQDRKAALEKQMAENDMLEKEYTMLGNPGGGQPTSQLTGTARRKAELQALLKKYSAKHPDVIRLQRELEASEVETPAKDTKSPPQLSSLRSGRSLKTTLATQVDDLKAEMAALQTKNKNVRDQIAVLQSRLGDTAIRAIELSKITRDYDITLKKYQDLLAKGLDSELSENMEKKQKGEQFQIVDRANLPRLPVGPNRPRIIIVGVLLGLGAGLGVAVLLELLNTAFKRGEDVGGYAGVPLLVTLPIIPTRGRIIAKRQERSMLILASAIILVVGMVLIPFIAPVLPML
jgi:protein tyrosine kinase modulator